MLHNFISTQKNNTEIGISLSIRQYRKYMNYKLINYLYSLNNNIYIVPKNYNNKKPCVPDEKYIYHYMDWLNIKYYKYRIKNTTQIFELHINSLDNFPDYCTEYIIKQIKYISKYIPFIFISFDIRTEIESQKQYENFVKAYKNLITTILLEYDFNNIVVIRCIFGVIDDYRYKYKKYKSINYTISLKFKSTKNKLITLFNKCKYYFILYLIS